MTDEITSLLDSAEMRVAVAKDILHNLVLLCALWGLMKLQYDHEGHIDDAVSAHYSQEIHDLEQQLANYVRLLTPEDVPF